MPLPTPDSEPQYSAQDELPPVHKMPSVLRLVGAVAIAVVLGLVLNRVIRPPRPAPAEVRGPQEMAPIRGSGWVGEKGPSPEELAGKIIVLDTWAYWCGPCRLAIQELKPVHEQYAPQGVVFLGATTYGDSRKTENEQFIDSTKPPWPNLTGAVHLFEQMQIDMIPTVFIVDQKNRVRYRGQDPDDMKKVLDDLLAHPPE